MEIKQPYAILSDQHCHDWNQFSKILPNKVNSRLQIILDEMHRAATTLLNAGGRDMIFAGDLFHVRGKIQPSVFNPTYAAIAQICARGVRIFAIPGNHDLEGKDSEEVGNAMQTLEQIEGFTVVTDTTAFGNVIMIPWMNDVNELMQELGHYANGYVIPASECHTIVHAPLNGVIRGIPDIGLDVKELEKLGFKLFFAGHFHDHKNVSLLGEVWSIGATTHQTWNDPGTMAGFIIVNNDLVEHHESHAPKFINFDEATSERDFKGNYVRIREKDISLEEAQKIRKQLEEAGAIGIVDHSSKKQVSNRVGVTVETGASLEKSVTDYVDSVDAVNHREEVKIQSLKILDEARNMAGGE